MKLLGITILLCVVVSSTYADEDPWGVYGEVCLANQPNVYNPGAQYDVQWFNVNLDEDPKTRWRTVAKAHAQNIVNTLNTVRDFLSQMIGEVVWDILVGLMDDAIYQIDEPYRSELEGFAEASGLDVREITLLNLFYEIAKGCTSIVAETPDGKIYHGRNQDFGTFFIWDIARQTWEQTAMLKTILINVNYIRGGKTVYKGVTFAGHMGVLTGLKPHTFTLSTNARFGSTMDNLIAFFNEGQQGRQFLIWADRDVLEKANSYDEAVQYLSTTPLVAYGYFIVGGRKSGEGAVITRNPNGTDHVESLKPNDPKGWYVLQTNYDWDKEVLYLDDRRAPGHDCMNRLTRQNVGLEGLFQVLSSKPNLNKATVYTSVMQVDDVVLQSFLRNCTNPCWFV